MVIEKSVREAPATVTKDQAISISGRPFEGYPFVMQDVGARNRGLCDQTHIPLTWDIDYI